MSLILKKIYCFQRNQSNSRERKGVELMILLFTNNPTINVEEKRLRLKIVKNKSLVVKNNAKGTSTVTGDKLESIKEKEFL